MENADRRRDIRNEISGRSSGPTVQAGEITGGVHFHQAGQVYRPIPRQLLPAPVRFTGRDRELGELDEIGASGALVVIVLTGPGGVGKTALALQWAHRVSN